jgi:hypothetical protein
MTNEDVIKNGYKDWLELLKHTNNMSLLTDPYNIWLEAFKSGTLFERMGAVHVLSVMQKHASSIAEQNILQGAIAAIESKGMSK